MAKKSVNPIVDTAPEAFGPLFDSHSHINSSEFDGDREAVVGRMRAAGLVGAITIACDWDEIEKLHEVVGLAPGVLDGAWALHPEYEERREPTVEEIIRICSADDIVAVGETGLDYYWCKGDLTWQKERFVRHIEAAKALDEEDAGTPPSAMLWKVTRKSARFACTCPDIRAAAFSARGSSILRRAPARIRSTARAGL